MKIGILSFQGGVAEHVLATKTAAKALGMPCEVVEVKRKGEFGDLDGLVIPGGESTTLCKLIAANGLWGEVASVGNIFGTCAGAILLAKKVIGQEEGGQKTLGLMDIEADRNAYGSQVDSFEEEVEAKLGTQNPEPIAKSARAPSALLAGELPTRLCEYFSNEPNTVRLRTVPSISEGDSSKNLITLNAVFIRAPKIIPLGGKCEILAKRKNGEAVAISQKLPGRFYLAASFHPELSTTRFHEYFLKAMVR